MPEPALEAAARIGPYEVLGLVGEGGMARVYAVRHPRSGERRAIKVMSLASRQAQARFAREARMQRRVEHANVLPVLDVLQVGGQPALVLPLVEGPSLARWWSLAPPPLGQRLAVFRALVEGVAAIHAAGLVHRDLKPANVLADRTGVRVADFGIAKALATDAEALTVTGAAIGTPAYMAPEQKRDASNVDARADVFALGQILYEWVGRS